MAQFEISLSLNVQEQHLFGSLEVNFDSAKNYSSRQQKCPIQIFCAFHFFQIFHISIDFFHFLMIIIVVNSCQNILLT